MKSRKVITLFFLATSLSFGASNDQYVVSNGSFLALYKNRDRNPNETAKLRVPQTELLKVVATRGSHILVETSKGEKGWVEKWLVVSIKTTAESLPEKEIIADKATSPIVCIAPESASPSTLIVPNRSFTDNLKKDISKETTY